jgi:hypothetical protein
MNPSAGPAVVTIDVAHPPLSSEAAEAALDAWLRRQGSGGTRVILKIIHGYGSSGKGGTLKDTVRNWAYRRREKFSLVIPGEDFSVFDPDVQDAIREAGNPPLASFSDINQGMTLLFPG